MSFRDEFRLKNFGFSGVSVDRFHMSQWHVPGIVAVLYRFIIAIYTTVTFAVTFRKGNVHGAENIPLDAFLTIWTYAVLTIYFITHAVVTLAAYACCRNSNHRNSLVVRRDISEHTGLFHELQGQGDVSSNLEEQPLLNEMATVNGRKYTWYSVIVWILFNIASTASLMVTLIFWTVLLPMLPNLDETAKENENIQLHLVNSVLVLLEHAMTAVPVRLLHVIYPLIYGLVYMFFSLFYWVDDHSHVIYPILDWGKPGPTVGYVFLVGFVVIPLFQLFIYLLYRLKLKIFSLVFRHVEML